MGDITNPKLIILKGLLLLLVGLMASSALLLEHPDLKVAFLLAVAVWGFARFYYFAFYVVQHYIDPSFRFAGLTSVLRHLFATRPGGGK